MWQKVFGTLAERSWRLQVFSVVIVAPLVLHAQYDIGASFGAYNFSLSPRISEGHESASFNGLRTPAWLVSVYYRERSAKRTNLGLQFQFTRKSFDAQFSDAGLSGGNRTTARVDLDLLHLNTTLEIKLNESGNAVVRFGPQFGFKVGGSMTGDTSSSGLFSSDRSAFVGIAPAPFKGDIRVLFGFGLTSRNNKDMGLSFDPYFSTAIGSILKNSPGAKGAEVGATLGCSIGFVRTTLMQWIDRRMPTPPTGPNW